MMISFFVIFLAPYTKDQSQIRGYPPPRQGFTRPELCNIGGIDGYDLHELRCPRIEVSSAVWTEARAWFAVLSDASHLESPLRLPRTRGSWRRKRRAAKIEIPTIRIEVLSTRISSRRRIEVAVTQIELSVAAGCVGSVPKSSFWCDVFDLPLPGVAGAAFLFSSGALNEDYE
jgi:hypothetical protein